MVNNRIELTDEELDKVVGGITTNHGEYQRKHEIEAGEFVPDAYKPIEKNNNPNELNLIKINNSNSNPNIDNNYEPMER